MDFKANSGVWGTMFGVPCIVADNFLKLATGEQLKVLLYILRCAGRSCSDEEIAMNTGISVQQAADAVMFWEQVNVLIPQSPSPVSTIMSSPQPVQTEAVNEIKAPEPIPEQTENIKSVPRQKQNLNPSEIAKMISESNEIAELFKIAEAALGTLSHTQQNSLIWMYSYLGLKLEVIVTLIYYCISIEKTSSGYIEKIACDWADNDINTLNAAQEEVQRLTMFNDFTGKIMKKFEMIRRPTPKQNEFIEQWKNAGFSLDLIGYAYEKTIEQINKLSFDYINKVLLSWKDSGFTTVKQVRDAENDYKNNRGKKSKNSGGSGSDVDKYKIVINKF